MIVAIYGESSRARSVGRSNQSPAEIVYWSMLDLRRRTDPAMLWSQAVVGGITNQLIGVAAAVGPGQIAKGPSADVVRLVPEPRPTKTGDAIPEPIDDDYTIPEPIQPDFDPYR